MQLNDLLQDQIRTFIYSKAQRALAGTDGEEEFNAVFGEKSRTAAILYRPGWGDSAWTRVEETAIKNRALTRDGYDFATFIILDDGTRPPKWVPRTRLYYSLQKYGLEGAAGALLARVQDQGGEPAVETLAARAARLNRAAQFHDAKQRFAHSLEGVQAARAAYTELDAETKRLLPLIQTVGVECEAPEVPAGLTLVSSRGLVLLVCLRNLSSLDDARLQARFFDGFPPLPGYIVFDKPNLIEAMDFSFGLAGPDRSAWLREGKEYSSEQLADFLLKRFMDLKQATFVAGRRG